MCRTTISHFYFLMITPRRCPPCLGKSAFHLRRRVPDEAIPSFPPRMRLREQTGWGFAGTLLKESPQERGRKLTTSAYLQRRATKLKESPQERGRKLSPTLTGASAVTLLKESPQERGRKLHVLNIMFCQFHRLKESPQERGRKQCRHDGVHLLIEIERKSPRKGTKTLRVVLRFITSPLY